MNRRLWTFIGGGLLVALVLAGVVSTYASAHPDGLESALREGCAVDADDTIVGGSCPATREEAHEIGGPLADYGLAGVRNDMLATGLSGVVGVLLTFAVGGGACWLLRRRDPTPAGTDPTPAGTGADPAVRPGRQAAGPVDPDSGD
ncbi:cobalamin biosynthesis protein CbiM [Micromonospora rosaria]|uniref:Cobalamin biosynthesis protein CbiM n=1 Tax=Micromonospora rosaria TaxID=47874 RepID=A0A136PW51_9ACTN|nr:PDGLE domain-containing protein [Micromonospora rosaria]KXK62720.1 cobalamin biosynthesis protein CbiM [Micromonospora rosaria]